MKKLTALVLCLILVVSFFSFNVTAAEDEITPTVESFVLTDYNDQTLVDESAEVRASGLILSYGLSLSKSGTTLKLAGLTNCSLEVVKCGFKNLVVERRKTSSDSWEEYYDYGNVYVDGITANLSTSLSVASGYQYRLSCKHYAKKNLLSTQSISNTSNVVAV